MAADSRVLEQVNPAATTETDLYTVPANRRASVRVFASVVTGATVSVRVNKEGEADDDKQFLAKDKSISANTNESIPTSGYPILLSAGDVVAVESSQADTAFTINGYEDDMPT